jgi:sporulation protein YlmC with PRC-barrel domain
MFMKSSELIGRSVRATNGNIGEIKDLYFDIMERKLRYFAIDTGGWMSSRQSLIPPSAFTHYDPSSKKMNVNLTKEQVENSPDVDVDLPISRGMEENLAQHYQLPNYWEAKQGEVLRAPEEERIVVSRGEQTAVMIDRHGAQMKTDTIPGAQNLFSARNLFKYDVRSVDGKDLGDIEDLIIDNTGWHISYLVLDTGRLTPGKKVLVPPQRIECISDSDTDAVLNVSQEAVRNAPEYNAGRPLSLDYEKKLADYYGYGSRETFPVYALWRFTTMRHAMSAGKKLRIEVLAPAIVHWTNDNWKTTHELRTNDIGKGRHVVDLPTENTPSGESVHFTFFWPVANHWEGKNYSVKVVQAAERERHPAMAHA